MKKKIFFGMSVDDIALAHWCKVENLKNLLNFFSGEGVPATCFVVPIDEESDRPFYEYEPRFVDVIQQYYPRGFRFEQHGLRHNRFELGVPPAMVLDLPHETENKRYAEENREFLERDHSEANCRERLRQGREILETALGIKIKGFRAPALQESPGMFAALAHSGYLFDSSNVLQPTGWDYILDRLDVPPREINRAVYDELRRKSYGLMIPLTCDYTWYLTPAKYDAAMRLAVGDFRACAAAEIPFVTVCHVDPVHEGEGLRFLHEFFAFARSEAAATGAELEFATLETIAEELNR